MSGDCYGNVGGTIEERERACVVMLHMDLLGFVSHTEQNG